MHDWKQTLWYNSTKYLVNPFVKLFMVFVNGSGHGSSTAFSTDYCRLKRLGQKSDTMTVGINK